MKQISTLQDLQSKLATFPKFQNRFSVNVYSDDKTLIVKFTRLINISNPRNAYNSPWEVTRLFLRGMSKDLKGVFTEFSFVGEFEGEIEWSNSSPINSNGMIANTQQETIIAGIAIPLIVLVVLVVANFSKGTSTSPITPLEQAQVKVQNTQIIRGGEVFRSLKGIYQTAGEATATPVVRVVVPQSGWKKLSKSDQISLAIYAESLVSVVKSNPSNYVSIPSSAPIYNSFVSKIANLCQDCWSIVVSRQDSQPYGIDETIVQGDTPWRSDDPCCRGIKSSEFKK